MMPRDDNEYNRLATEYDPIKIGSIDGTDSEAHDRGVLRALRSEYVPNKQVRGDPRHTLFIGRLNHRTTQETIHSEFSKFGNILNCRLVKDIVTGKSKQYAFVEYENMSSTDTAWKDMHAEMLDGSELIVEREAERRLVGWRPRRLGGGFGGRKESGQLRFGCRVRPFRKPFVIGQNVDLVLNNQRREHNNFHSKKQHKTGCRQSVWSCTINVCVCHKNVNCKYDCKMCSECWKEFKGWIRSFTRTECALSALQLVLLVLFIGFLTFLILHLLACSATERHHDIVQTKTSQEPFSPSSSTSTSSTTKSIYSTNPTTLSPDVDCTWRPSEKTDIVIHYYENGQVSTSVATNSNAMSTWRSAQDNVSEEPGNGEMADDVHKSYILALGKVNIPQDVTFGCILSIISEYWTLTAASCIEAIEEVDSVDTFVIIEKYGDRYIGQLHTVTEVLIHPEYQGINKKYDVAVLKSENSLVKYDQAAVTLPSMLDALLITIGEEFSLLGYESPRGATGVSERGQARGAARGEARGAGGRAVLRVLRVRTLSGAQCAGGWAPRHLARGAAAGAGACGAAPLCAGPARAAPACSHCAGAPLLRDSRLLGVLAAGPCGDACGPALYVNIGTVVDWLNSTIYS